VFNDLSGDFTEDGYIDAIVVAGAVTAAVGGNDKFPGRLCKTDRRKCYPKNKYKRKLYGDSPLLCSLFADNEQSFLILTFKFSNYI
jgi:hypothetical protein